MTQEWRTRETDPLKRIVAELGELRGSLTSITNGILTNAGLVVAKGLLRVIQSMRVEGNLDVTGTLTTSGDTTLGGNVDVTGDLDTSGDTTLGGNVSITGTLSLPAGIIDNDALTSPLWQTSGYGNSADFSIPDSAPGAQQAVLTVTVPTGYTSASFIATATGAVRNLGTARTFAYMRVWAEAPGFEAWGSRANTEIDAGTVRTISAVLVRNIAAPLAGGDVLTFYVTIYADTAQAADDANFASTAALVTFTR